MNDNEMRDALYRAVCEEFVGPTDVMSEEQLKWISPKNAYSAGVLYPQGQVFEEIDSSEDSDIANEPIGDDEEIRGIVIESKGRSLADDEEPISLSNAEFQSAISLTVAIKRNDVLSIKVYAGEYEKGLDGKTVIYRRKPIYAEFEKIDIPTQESCVSEKKVPATSLSLILVYRYEVDGNPVITIALRNTKKSKQARSCPAQDCYFQCSFIVQSEMGFAPLPTFDEKCSFEDEEELLNKLIYSEIRNYAIGHGCAADWSDEESGPHTIQTKTIPVSEVKPTMSLVPELSDVSFDMNMFGDPNRWEESLVVLKTLCKTYQTWIADQETSSLSFQTDWMKHAARIAIDKCKTCLNRMRQGIEALKQNGTAREAFQLANKAMLMQYLHYSVVSNECKTIRPEGDGLRLWRPFQIAFILMNIEAITSEESEDRNLLDLIWFPTGGGKTEAYLGLSAYVLLLERLNKEECAGTTIIMRYTLRLLSAQQFTRAASLICALEIMRRKDPDKLGKKRFSIGFWVGSAASPNDWKEALAIFNNLKNGNNPNGSIPVTQCPWCGHRMGEKGSGYKRVRNNDKRREGDNYLLFVCPNEHCDFGEKNNPLPLKVVDDEIYFEPPSLLLGTVDKFAMIPYRPESYALFGISDDGSHKHAPKLIIQDELHLISGPLGSMTAHYETLIEELCSYRDSSGIFHHPKIIASTATVSRAREQCHELFGCEFENVVQFPPPGISYADSFFARLDKENPGRRYIGIYTSNLSYATASIKLYTQLLWEPNTWELEDPHERDRYWTVIGYYSSTRELGQALTWTASDIPERLREKMKNNPLVNKRYLNEVIELTGRKDAPEVHDGLERLALKRLENGCVDLCLATNMISVGLDVPRLGVMMIAGQPKETSEYIQASSRVGRGETKGMVFVLYGTTRPRDRSHYESFRNYHESLYQHVEPSSVTAFCSQVRKRAMPGTLFGLYRSKDPGLASPNNPAQTHIDTARNAIAMRVSKVDPTELEEAESQLDAIIEDWNLNDYERWASLSPDPSIDSDPLLPLMHPYGGKTDPRWLDQSFGVPTSMRSVDEECKVKVIGRYPSNANEEE